MQVKARQNALAGADVAPRQSATAPPKRTRLMAGARRVGERKCTAARITGMRVNVTTYLEEASSAIHNPTFEGRQRIVAGGSRRSLSERGTGRPPGQDVVLHAGGNILSAFDLFARGRSEWQLGTTPAHRFGRPVRIERSGARRSHWSLSALWPRGHTSGCEMRCAHLAVAELRAALSLPTSVPPYWKAD